MPGIFLKILDKSCNFVTFEKWKPWVMLLRNSEIPKMYCLLFAKIRPVSTRKNFFPVCGKLSCGKQIVRNFSIIQDLRKSHKV